MISCLGDGVAITALMLHFHQSGVGSSGMAALFAALAVPGIACAGAAGRVADRLSFRPVVALTGSAMVMVSAIMACTESVPVLVGLLALLSCLMAVTGPTLTKSVLDATASDQVNRAAARVSMGASAGYLIGPAAAGPLLDGVGLRGVLLVNAVTYLALPAVAALARFPRAATAVAKASPGDAGSPRRSSGPGLASGLRALMARPLTARTVLLGSAITFALQFTNVAEIYLVRDVYGASGTVFGMLTVVVAAGQLLGAWLAGNLLARHPVGPLGTLSALVIGSALVSIALLHHVLLLFALTALYGIANGGFGVGRQTALALSVPRGSRGSAVAAWNALANTATVAALGSAGVVGTAAPPQALFAAAGALVVLAALPISTRWWPRRWATTMCDSPRPSSGAGPSAPTI